MIRRSVGQVPEYLQNVVVTQEKRRRVKRQAPTKDRLLFAEAKESMDFIDHGFGTLEDSKTGVIWYREGNEIYRADSLEDQALRRALTMDKV